MIKQIANFIQNKHNNDKVRLERAKGLYRYMTTMTLPEQRLIRDRNKTVWHPNRGKPLSEFQVLVKNYLES